MYQSFSIIFAIAAVLSFLNYKYLHLPNTIGQLILGLTVAILFIPVEAILPETYSEFYMLVKDANFTHILLDIMLGFLLFAGSLHVDIYALRKESGSVLLFATLGVLISTFLIGSGLYGLTVLLNCELPFLHCLLFGALISPTDPIAVLALLKGSSVSPSLQLKIEGESLFNDGIGVIVFTAILLLTQMQGMSEASEGGSIVMEILWLFVEEVFLGLLLGLVLGWAGFRLMRQSQDDPYLTTILSLAVVFGGYSLAHVLETSGPLAMVVAGLYVGNNMEQINERSSEALSGFWHILDESLNGVLFVYLGLALHLVALDQTMALLAVLVIVLVLLARFLAVLMPYSLLKHTEHHWLKTTYVLTWGGLRGGISLALAFSLAPELSKDSLLFLTYTTVIFSILVQGLTIPVLTKKLYT
ncbi:MAG: sodium:proton antiporter [Saprospiraceae bacterium]|nr:sodium:proton antiporter [Saprospiraceae bacterium]